MAEGYRVQPDAVAAVLADTATAGADIARAAIPLRGALQASGAAADGTAGAGLITAALQALDEDVAAAMAVISTRLPSASQGLRDATGAVVSGDETIAAQIGGSGTAAFRIGRGRGMR